MLCILKLLVHLVFICAVGTRSLLHWWLLGLAVIHHTYLPECSPLGHLKVHRLRCGKYFKDNFLNSVICGTSRSGKANLDHQGQPILWTLSYKTCLMICHITSEPGKLFQLPIMIRQLSLCNRWCRCSSCRMDCNQSLKISWHWDTSCVVNSFATTCILCILPLFTYRTTPLWANLATSGWRCDIVMNSTQSDSKRGVLTWM